MKSVEPAMSSTLLDQAVDAASGLSEKLQRLSALNGELEARLSPAAIGTINFLIRDTQALTNLASTLEHWDSHSKAAVLTQLRESLAELEQSFGAIAVSGDVE